MTRYHVRDRPDEPRYYVEAEQQGEQWVLRDWQGQESMQTAEAMAKYYEVAEPSA